MVNAGKTQLVLFDQSNNNSGQNNGWSSVKTNQKLRITNQKSL